MVTYSLPAPDQADDQHQRRQHPFRAIFAPSAHWRARASSSSASITGEVCVSSTLMGAFSAIVMRAAPIAWRSASLAARVWAAYSVGCAERIGARIRRIHGHFAGRSGPGAPPSRRYGPTETPISNTEWVTKITVQPIASRFQGQQVLVQPVTRVISSSAAKGSSIRISRGRVTSARAMETRIFMPPDKLARIGVHENPQARRVSAPPGPRPAHRVVGFSTQAKRQPDVVLATVSPRHQRGFLEHNAQDRRSLCPPVPAQSLPDVG